LVVSRSLYVDTNNITAGVTVLPPNCSIANCPIPVTAVVGSAYLYVWNNDSVDGSFGVTSKIFLDQITPSGTLVNSLEVPNSSQNGVRFGVTASFAGAGGWLVSAVPVKAADTSPFAHNRAFLVRLSVICSSRLLMRPSSTAE
jgi:hypothetical protein